MIYFIKVRFCLGNLIHLFAFSELIIEFRESSFEIDYVVVHNLLIIKDGVLDGVYILLLKSIDKETISLYLIRIIIEEISILVVWIQNCISLH